MQELAPGMRNVLPFLIRDAKSCIDCQIILAIASSQYRSISTINIDKIFHFEVPGCAGRVTCVVRCICILYVDGVHIG